MENKSCEGFLIYICYCVISVVLNTLHLKVVFLEDQSWIREEANSGMTDDRYKILKSTERVSRIETPASQNFRLDVMNY